MGWMDLRVAGVIGVLGTIGAGGLLGSMSGQRVLAQGDDGPEDLPRVTVTEDNTRISRSCVVVIPEGTAIADTDGNGVLHISRGGITVRFAEGSELRGKLQPDIEREGWDTLTGTGITLKNARDVTLVNASVHGYRVGLHAENADGLVIDGGDYSDNYRKRLESNAQAEVTTDWMSPHRNDNDEWVTNYGGAIYIENSSGVVVRDVFMRRGQHGILLDEVTEAQIYDNDVSFMSGWGLAMFRSSESIITRNAFDFCVRGHVEGVYNRGQDSAGILMFEQCNNNIVVENSATHGGDGFFGYGGHGALGVEEFAKAPAQHRRLGVNDNLFKHNDFSYAPAHGLELTFSFGNIILNNRFAENAICGIWGGYSQDTYIANNLFERNSGMPYGTWERGGVNFEHARNVIVTENTFINNRVGVHFWWRNPAGVLAVPWGQANYSGATLEGNVISDNTFTMNRRPDSFHRVSEGEELAGVWLTDLGNGGNIDTVNIFDNRFDTRGGAQEIVQPSGETEIGDRVRIREPELPEYEVLGETRPVTIRDGIAYSRRQALGGRHNIIMGEWGPWDHEGVMIRPVGTSADSVKYQIFGASPQLEVEGGGDGVRVNLERVRGDNVNTIDHALLTITGRPGVRPYEVTLSDPARNFSATEKREPTPFEHTFSGTLIGTEWQCVAFAWSENTHPVDNYEEWRDLARGAGAVRFQTDALDLPFGFGSPSTLDLGGRVRDAGLPGDQFGLIATTRVRLPAGTWEFTTVSDDGVRLRVNGETLIENWKWHPPETDTALFTTDEESMVEIALEYFELNGFATLSFAIEPADKE